VLIDSSHPILDFCSLLIILLAAVNYGWAGLTGTDIVAAIDPLPPTFAIVIGLSGIWHALRQRWF